MFIVSCVCMYVCFSVPGLRTKLHYLRPGLGAIVSGHTYVISNHISDR